MKKLNPFFAIGTIGMIVISVLHIFLAILLPHSSVHQTFFILYPAFMAFLAIGSRQILKAQKTLALIRIHK